MCSEDEAEHEDISDNATARNADGVLPAGCTCERGWAGLVLLTVPPQVRKLPAARTFPTPLSSPRADYGTAPPPPNPDRG